MKRLLFFITALFLLVSVEGQILRYSNSTAQAAPEEPSADPPSFLSIDGYTLGWYQIGDGSSTYLTLDGDTIVSAWKDQSGNSNDLVQTTTGNKPLWDSGNDEIDIRADDYITDESFPTSHPSTVYAVVNIHTATSGRIIELHANTYLALTAPPTYEYLTVIGSETINLTSSDYTLDTYYLIMWIINDDVEGGSAFGMNGTIVNTGTGGASSGSFLRLKNEYGTMVFSIKELIFREGVVDSESNQNDIETYLNNKYSIY